MKTKEETSGAFIAGWEARQSEVDEEFDRGVEAAARLVHDWPVIIVPSDIRKLKRNKT